MVKIVERLPQSLQSRWKKLVLETLEATGRYLSIVKFTRFISETAREATDTVFGVSESKSKDSSPRSLRRPGRAIGSNFGVLGHEDQQCPESQANINDPKFKNAKATRHVEVDVGKWTLPQFLTLYGF